MVLWIYQVARRTKMIDPIREICVSEAMRLTSENVIRDLYDDSDCGYTFYLDSANRVWAQADIPSDPMTYVIDRWIDESELEFLTGDSL